MLQQKILCLTHFLNETENKGFYCISIKKKVPDFYLRPKVIIFAIYPYHKYHWTTICSVKINTKYQQLCYANGSTRPSITWLCCVCL